ncbi:MAG: LysM peptidoglycan-binding domain-containing protein, partial [Candidatus Sericytochromatia bacterium]
MSDPRVTGPNMEAMLQAARERMAAEQRRLAEQQAQKAAQEAGSSVNAAEHAAETARQAPIEEDVFVREGQIAQSTEEDRQQIYDRFNTDGEDGLADGEFEHAFAAASIEGAEITGERPQPSGTPDRAMEVIESARASDRQTLEDAQAALESLPADARAEYEGQVQALQEAYDQKWTIPDEAMKTIGEATIDEALPEPGDKTAEAYEQQLVGLAEGDQQTIDDARRALEHVPTHLRDAHAAKVQALEAQFEAKWEAPPAETAPEAAGAPETYTVEAGDSLSRIAQEMTGDAGRWQEL